MLLYEFYSIFQSGIDDFTIFQILYDHINIDWSLPVMFCRNHLKMSYLVYLQKILLEIPHFFGNHVKSVATFDHIRTRNATIVPISIQRLISGYIVFDGNYFNGRNAIRGLSCHVIHNSRTWKIYILNLHLFTNTYATITRSLNEELWLFTPVIWFWLPLSFGRMLENFFQMITS